MQGGGQVPTRARRGCWVTDSTGLWVSLVSLGLGSLRGFLGLGPQLIALIERSDLLSSKSRGADDLPSNIKPLRTKQVHFSFPFLNKS